MAAGISAKSLSAAGGLLVLISSILVIAAIPSNWHYGKVKAGVTAVANSVTFGNYQVELKIWTTISGRVDIEYTASDTPSNGGTFRSSTCKLNVDSQDMLVRGVDGEYTTTTSFGTDSAATVTTRGDSCVVPVLPAAQGLSSMTWSTNVTKYSSSASFLGCPASATQLCSPIPSSWFTARRTCYAWSELSCSTGTGALAALAVALVFLLFTLFAAAGNVAFPGKGASETVTFAASAASSLLLLISWAIFANKLATMDFGECAKSLADGGKHHLDQTSAVFGGFTATYSASSDSSSIGIGGYPLVVTSWCLSIFYILIFAYAMVVKRQSDGSANSSQAPSTEVPSAQPATAITSPQQVNMQLPPSFSAPQGMASPQAATPPATQTTPPALQGSPSQSFLQPQQSFSQVQNSLQMAPGAQASLQNSLQTSLQNNLQNSVQSSLQTPAAVGQSLQASMPQSSFVAQATPSMPSAALPTPQLQNSTLMSAATTPGAGQLQQSVNAAQSFVQATPAAANSSMLAAAQQSSLLNSNPMPSLQGVAAQAPTMPQFQPNGPGVNFRG